MNIGVFDSGLGGLSVLKALIQRLPQYNYIYLGDNARVPYGGRSVDFIYEYTQRSVDFLMKQNCQLVILACNTATGVALRKIQQDYLSSLYPERRVLGVIRPAIEAVIETKSKKVGIMATRAAVNSQSFIHELNKFANNIEIYQQACPLLVPIIEEGELDWQGLDLIIEKYVQPLKEKQVDSVILGCTHYELIIEKISKHFDPTARIIAEGIVTAEKLQDYLHRHPEIENKLEKNSNRSYFATDLNERFTELLKRFMGSLLEDNHPLKLAVI